MNNALQGMRLVRSRGSGNLKAFVFVTQIRKSRCAPRQIRTDGSEPRMTPPFFHRTQGEKASQGERKPTYVCEWKTEWTS